MYVIVGDGIHKYSLLRRTIGGCVQFSVVRAFIFFSGDEPICVFHITGAADGEICTRNSLSVCAVQLIRLLIVS